MDCRRLSYPRKVPINWVSPMCALNAEQVRSLRLSVNRRLRVKGKGVASADAWENAVEDGEFSFGAQDEAAGLRSQGDHADLADADDLPPLLGPVMMRSSEVIQANSHSRNCTYSEVWRAGVSPVNSVVQLN